MTNPTSNYNFVLPTSSDLVTDLPADFEVALQGVDTRLKALQPGTTLGDIAYSSATANTNTRLPVGTNGQVLAVVAGVPAWQNGTTGDIEGVTAGIGISGGGTSGTVTVTNSMATAIDAKGDLVAGTGADAFSRLAVGANNTVLTADSAQATGLKWATPASPTFTTSRSFVATVEGTTSSSYTTLSTAVSVTVTTGTKALVMISGKCANGGASNKGAQIGFAISGSTTQAASDEYSIGFAYIGIANPFNMYAAGAFLVTGLTAGSNTFAQRYKNPEGGTDSYFGDRTISVIDLGS